MSDWREPFRHGEIVYDEDDGLIICGDCREILPKFPRVDVLITDPPYGVNIGSHGGSTETRPGFLVKGGYADYEDTPENFIAIIVPVITMALAKCDRAAVFTAGSMAWHLPIPVTVGGVYLPAGCGRCAWGFQNLAHVLFYGKAPDLQKGAKPTTIRNKWISEKLDHPTPKPIQWLKWLVGLVSRRDELIIDPFLGSGTTAVAAVQLNRRFVGIEISREYCELAADRVRAAKQGMKLNEYRQGQKGLF